jgi:hypothetical protein
MANGQWLMANRSPETRNCPLTIGQFPFSIFAGGIGSGGTSSRCVRFTAAISVGAGDNEAMTEKQWLASEDPCRMLTCLQSETDRKLRLFVVAICRAVWQSLSPAVSARVAWGVKPQKRRRRVQRSPEPRAYALG